MKNVIQDIVTEIAEKQIRLKQNEVEQKSNQDNADRLAEELAELTAKLADTKKPKLRHGDVRRWPCASKSFYGGLWSIADLSDSGDIKQVWIGGKTNQSIKAEGYPNISDSVEMFNIIDDLKALQENVTKFEVDDFGGESIKCWVSDDDDIRISFNKQCALFLKPDEFSAFILKLRQMEATLKRQ